ncbi:MAG: class F sortase [Dehalococcoidia bacterium]
MSAVVSIRRVWIAAAAACLGLTAVACSGDGDAARPSATTAASSPTPTTPRTTTPADPIASATVYSGRPAPGVNPSMRTPAPAASGQPITFSPGATLLDSDLAARGYGDPGRGAFNISRVIIAAIGVDAPATSATVGSDGQMPSPPSIDVVVWYDFSMWPGLGGLPGAGGNVVLAGDAIKAGGSGVFTQLSRVSPGAFVRLVLTTDETLCYQLEFNKFATIEQFDQVVQATAEESVTLITGGTPSNRGVAWGRRATCAAEPAATPTSTPLAGHHKLEMFAEGLRFTISEGGTVPLGTHTVDYSLELRDAGVEHTIAFYDTAGRELIASEPVEGPATLGGAFGVGPPQPPGQYTFRCSIHPQMTGAITVLP